MAVALAAALIPIFALAACMSSESTGSGGGKGGSNGTGAGGSSSTTGAGGSSATTGAGGSSATTGAGGSSATTGAGGSSATTGAGGSSATTGAGGAAGGAGGTGPTTGTGGATGTGGTSGGVCAVDPMPEANCNTTLAKTGATCTKDCCITCGYQGLGAKNCTCMGGVYTACPCPKPATFMGAATAPYCDSLTSDGMGMTASLKNMACTTLWQECIGRDVVSGTTPQGCVCLLNATTNANQWYCGSTNKWFAPM
jgi:hypothetical protein